MTSCLIDSNVFIQAKNLHYGFDFCPAFWQWLTEQNKAGRVASIEKVEDELLSKNDELSEWVATQGSQFFLPSDDTLRPALRVVSDWAISQRYRPSAVSIFKQGADCWLVTHAMVHECTVVTHEIVANTVNKIKIPNVCAGLGLHCITPYEMLRRERARFVLGARERLV